MCAWSCRVWCICGRDWRALDGQGREIILKLFEKSVKILKKNFPSLSCPKKNLFVPKICPIKMKGIFLKYHMRAASSFPYTVMYIFCSLRPRDLFFNFFKKHFRCIRSCVINAVNYFPQRFLFFTSIRPRIYTAITIMIIIEKRWEVKGYREWNQYYCYVRCGLINNLKRLFFGF